MALTELLTNPKALILLGCLGALVLGLNLGLFGLLHGDKSAERDAAVWGRALRGGRDVRQRNEAQLDELHQAVSQLKSPPPTDKPDDG